MDHYTVNEEEIIEILSIAFEKGWSGYKDTQEAVIQELAQEFLKTKRKVRKRATKKKRRVPRNPSEWMMEPGPLGEISFQDNPDEGPITLINADASTWVIPDNWEPFTTGTDYNNHNIISGMSPPTLNEEDEEGQ